MKDLSFREVRNTTDALRAETNYSEGGLPFVVRLAFTEVLANARGVPGFGRSIVERIFGGTHVMARLSPEKREIALRWEEDFGTRTGLLADRDALTKRLRDRLTDQKQRASQLRAMKEQHACAQTGLFDQGADTDLLDYEEERFILLLAPLETGLETLNIQVKEIMAELELFDEMLLECAPVEVRAVPMEEAERWLG